MKIIKKIKKIELKNGDIFTIISKKYIDSLNAEEYSKLKNENPGFIGDMHRFCGLTVVVCGSSDDTCIVCDISGKVLPYTWHISYFKEFYQ